MNNPLHLLLLDDSPDYRLLLERELRQEFPGLQVTEIRDAQGFVQVLEKGQFDLVITDYPLRWMDGLKVLRAIKERYPQCPVIMFTATGSEGVAVEAMKAGLDDYVVESANHLIRLLTAVRTVWKQVQQHKVLEDAEATLRQAYTVIENSPVVIFRCRAEPDWPVEYVSPNIAQFGYTAEDFWSGRLSYQALMHPADRARVIRESETLRAGGVDRVIVEYRLLTKAGDVRWIENRCLAEWDPAGRITHYQGILLDITARKQAEEALQKAHAELEMRVQERTAELRETNRRLEQEIAERKQIEQALMESEERYRQLAEHIREVFWINSADAHQVLYVSPAYQDIWGRPCESLYEHPTAWLEAVHPEDRPRVQQAHARTTMTGAFDQEFRIVRPDGTIRWIRSRGFPIQDTAGEIYRIVGIAEDITQRKGAEEQMRQQQAELAHVARLALAGEMASGLAHELNQPLGAIATYIQACLLLIQSGQIMSEQLIETLEKVSTQAQRAGNIIHRLRDLVRKVKPHRNAMNINALLQEMVRLIEPEARQREIRIQLELGENLPLAFADAIQIQQVVLNLMRNALEAMTEAGTRHRELSLRTSRPGNETIEVAISDTGPGLSPEAMNRLFLPFFTTKPTGMGLGLSISKSIIEAHQGRLWAVPNPERGITFRFTLPCDLRRSPR